MLAEPVKMSGHVLLTYRQFILVVVKYQNEEHQNPRAGQDSI